MATGHRSADDSSEAAPLRVCVKGAPEAVLELCHQARGSEELRSLDDAELDFLTGLGGLKIGLTHLQPTVRPDFGDLRSV